MRWLGTSFRKHHIEMRKQIANLTSNILNPFLVSLVVVLLLSFGSTSSTLDALKWSLILIAVSILPVFSVILYLARHGRIESIFTNIRRERTKIYVVASVCAGASCVILHYLEAPLVLVATSVAGLSAVVLFMGVNLWWKISLHTAFIAASVTLLVILYESIAVVTVVLLPLVAWSRIELEHHSAAQAVIGALLAASIVVVVFYLFGLV